ncbi:4-hydroxy-tetrahydrodipicolinate synthase [Marinilactibacillus psychrotolerans 42ea]|uniref:4-hydroxy-tetrahydrodipicolinate synthase n=1 Tax=Marinilactibacillus psychrotolerans 42ea TaxID=1255609 RepID=A0A1R4IVE1_9LACT|nr:PEP phosphonomutase [Marinilactibacillus psychrotolerans]SJN23649.1 4-hydroxy-tetrahydrodipicolinate synthase [Marinilactibacillus psychrotolerans 42ea]
MVKRLLSCYASDFKKMDKYDLKASIKASEGRTILSENVVSTSVSHGLTNSEVAKAFGADLILLNGLDLMEPKIEGIDDIEQPIQYLKKLVGRPIGVNLEPVDESAKMSENKLDIPKGRQAFKETFEKANELGFDFICLTGNPGTGVSNKEIIKALKVAKEKFVGLIIAGKMHGAGVNEPVVDLNAIKEFIMNGADVILLPAVGTVPGVTTSMVMKAVQLAKKYDVLTLSAIGTSQETSAPSTIRDIALQNKIAGVDIQHIGDAGSGGVAPYQNLLELSRTIRGDRHTIARIAGSNER